MSSTIRGQGVHGVHFGQLYRFISNNSQYNQFFGVGFELAIFKKVLGAWF